MLDELLPRYDFSERHHLVVAAPPEQVYQAIMATTVGEMPLVWLLFAVRSLPRRLARTGGRSPARNEPLVAQMLAAGFTLLAEDPGREMVGGVVGQFWKLRGGVVVTIRNGSDFVAFDRPGFVKAAIGFVILEQAEGTRIETETRALATDAGSRRRFARYWRLIRPGSGAIRRSWLRAAARRAKRPLRGSARNSLRLCAVKPLGRSACRAGRVLPGTDEFAGAA
jgi:hypothetical protein